MQTRTKELLITWAAATIISFVVNLFFFIPKPKEPKHTHQYGKWETVVGVYSTYQRRSCTNCGWTMTADLGH